MKEAYPLTREELAAFYDATMAAFTAQSKETKQVLTEVKGLLSSLDKQVPSGNAVSSGKQSDDDVKGYKVSRSSSRDIKADSQPSDVLTEALRSYISDLVTEQIGFIQKQKQPKGNKRTGVAPGTKRITKKSIKAKQIMRTYCKAFGGSLSDKEVLSLTGVTSRTFYKYKKELKAEKKA